MNIRYQILDSIHNGKEHETHTLDTTCEVCGGTRETLAIRRTLSVRQCSRAYGIKTSSLLKIKTLPEVPLGSAHSANRPPDATHLHQNVIFRRILFGFEKEFQAAICAFFVLCFKKNQIRTPRLKS